MEVHVDGTIAVPFFVPLAFVEPTQGVSDPSHDTAVYVIVDGRLSEQAAPIRLRARSILTRSVSAGLSHMLRTTLELTATDAELEGAQFHVAAIPFAYPQLDSFDFGTQSMRSLFQFGYKCARAADSGPHHEISNLTTRVAMTPAQSRPNNAQPMMNSSAA